MKLTILQFAWGLQLEGMQHVVVSLAKKFKEKAHNSLVCATITEGELVNELNDHGIPYHFFGLKSSCDFRALIPIMLYLKSNKVNIVITHNFYGNLVPRVAAILSKIPVIIHVEHSNSDHKKLFQIIIEKILSIYTNKFICVSEKARSSLLEKVRMKPEKVHVIYNGIDIKHFAVQKINSKKNGAKKRVGIIARFSEEKGHIYFVKAASIIVKDFANIEFIYIGDGPLRSIIENEVTRNGLDRYSHFLGIRSDINYLLNTLDVFVLPSLREGLPLSLLEAQYAGVASIVTEVGGNPEIIEDGYNGLLVPPRNSEKLADAILRLLKHDNLKKQLALNGKKGFGLKFSSETMACAYIDLIYAIIKSKSRKYQINYIIF